MNHMNEFHKFTMIVNTDIFRFYFVFSICPTFFPLLPLPFVVSSPSLLFCAMDFSNLEILLFISVFCILCDYLTESRFIVLSLGVIKEAAL